MPVVSLPGYVWRSDEARHRPRAGIVDHGNQIQRLKQAINNSVQASNHSTADDKKGGSHEEGGIAYTKDGVQTVAPAQPGAYKDVKQPGVVEVDPFKAANPAQQKPGDVQADIGWHVHPSAEITETTGPQSAAGTTTIGRKKAPMRSMRL